MHSVKKIFCLAVLLSPFCCRALPQNDTVSLRKDTAARYYVKNRFSEYEPNYFISNFGQNYFGQVKFKISFKFDLALPYQKNKAYFAYTQVAFWDLYAPSAPMRELDFTPTLFYEHDFYKVFHFDTWHFTVIDYKVGYLHQSDGQPDGPLNRSIFKLTGNADMEFTRNVRGQQALGLDVLTVILKSWIWNMVDADNKNIADYQGYGQLITVFKFDYNDKSRTNGFRSYPLEINDAFTPAKAGLTNELNLLFDPFIGQRRAAWVPYVFLQYFHGFGENLINYDNRYNNYQPLNEFRLGVQFRVF